MRTGWFIAGLVALASTAQAKEYRIGGATDNGAELVDATSLRRSGDIVQGSAVAVMLAQDGKSYSRLSYKAEWDCAAMRVKMAPSEASDASGKVTKAMPGVDWRTLAAGSVAARTLTAACAASGGARTIEAESLFEASKILGEMILGKPAP